MIEPFRKVGRVSERYEFSGLAVIRSIIENCNFKF